MSRRKAIWGQFEQIRTGETARAKCIHCSTEINKNIPTLHNHLTNINIHQLL